MKSKTMKKNSPYPQFHKKKLFSETNVTWTTS